MAKRYYNEYWLPVRTVNGIWWMLRGRLRVMFRPGEVWFQIGNYPRLRHLHLSLPRRKERTDD